MEVTVVGMRGNADFGSITSHFIGLGGECVLLEPSMVCGRGHAEAAAFHALRAMRNGTNRSKDLLTETILFAASDRQIHRAMEKMRPRDLSEGCVAVLYGISDPELDAIGMTRDDSLMDADADKASRLGLDDPYIPYEDQAIEMVAMLELLKQ
ncbi:MAG: hypothetical protein IJ856_04025 [Candidatus Methanomethylophilaceae archaeon]|nr:hypothetical protein [Candidatus Methanomethylophilaceae archaeon]